MARLLVFVFVTHLAYFSASTSAIATPLNIAFLKSRDLAPYNLAIKGFEDKLGLSGSKYDMKGDLKKGLEIAEKILKQKPDLVVAVGTKAAIVLSEKIHNIPIIFFMVSRPEKYLLNKSNVTGISLNPDPKEQFRLLSLLVPKARKIGVIYDHSNIPKAVKYGLEAQKKSGISIIEETISSQTEIPEALRNIRAKTDALWLVMDDMVITRRSLRHIVKFSIDNNYPVIGFSKKIVKSGALFTSVTSFEGIGRRGASLAKKILGGEPPSSIPFTYPKPNGFVLNLKTARLLNIIIPEKVLEDAQKVYK